MDTIEIFMLVIAVIVIIIIIVFYSLGVFKTVIGPLARYEKQPQLLSPAELTFFNALVRSAGADKYVLSKVRIADLLQVAGLLPESNAWWKSFSTIAKKHVDFVVCRRSDMQPLVLVELDDKSHLSEKAQKRDALVNEACTEAGYPMLRIPVGMHGYETKKLAALIIQAIRTQTQVHNQAALTHVLSPR